jgi:Flp pilus assembly protein TadD
MKRGALEDAESVLRMAQTLRPDAVEVQVHLVEVLSRRGDAAGARAIAVRLLKGSSSLSADVRSRLRVLAK